MRAQNLPDSPLGYDMILACSGSSDIGTVTDRAAQVLAKESNCEVFGMVRTVDRVNQITRHSKLSKNMLVIDGCPMNCTLKSLNDAGITDFKHFQVADTGMCKGKTPITEENIYKLVRFLKEMLITV